jgi:hypothetical protein
MQANMLRIQIAENQPIHEVSGCVIDQGPGIYVETIAARNPSIGKVHG